MGKVSWADDTVEVDGCSVLALPVASGEFPDTALT